MKEKIKENKILFSIICVGFVIFFAIAYYIMSSNKTVKAVVLNQDVKSGTTITEEMVDTIEVNASTPEGFLREKDSVIGYKLKSSVSKNQLLYESDFMSSFADYSESGEIPEDYVITSVCVPDERACGGIITPGDYVDIMLVSDYSSAAYSETSTATEVNGTGRSDTGTSVAYILANVYVLSTNSSLSEAQESDLSSVANSNGNSEGSFYIFALSYDDAKKLRQAEGVENGKLWLNICPSQNQEEGKKPLIKQMIGNSYSFLHDAQEQVQDKDGKMLTKSYYTSTGEAVIEQPEENNESNSESTETDVENKEKDKN